MNTPTKTLKRNSRAEAAQGNYKLKFIPYNDAPGYTDVRANGWNVATIKNGALLNFQKDMEAYREQVTAFLAKL